MPIYKGKKITVEISGESHGKEISVTAEGFPEMRIDFDGLSAFMERRKPKGRYSTARREEDVPVFSGLSDGVIAGKFSASIKNADVRKEDYADLYGKPRPSHADVARYIKYGTLDFSGGGEFSGRMTAPLCVVGAIAKQYLKEKYGTQISAYVSEIGCARGRSYKDGYIEKRLADVSGKEFPCIDGEEEMLSEIEKAINGGDSVGGRIECIVYAPPAGLGGSAFDGLDGKISSLLYAVPAVKGVEFGEGFGFCSLLGSKANDQMRYDGGIKFDSDRSGGILGGISTGSEITLSVAVKPVPSIKKEQTTVDLINKTTAKIKITGRHDACIAPRAVPAIESAVALALLDEVLSEK